MIMVLFSLLVLILLMITAILWIIGISKMKDDPDYKGHNFLDWDDNKQHTENT